jgi:hypothetical protein
MFDIEINKSMAKLSIIICKLENDLKPNSFT